MQEIDVREQLMIEARLSADDLQIINKRRRDHNRLGFAYQLVYVRIYNQFPRQQPFEVIDDIVLFIGIQLDISPDAIIEYSIRRETLSEHQDIIRDYLQIRRFADVQPETYSKFLFDEACRLEQTHALLARFKEYLKQQRILDPADYTLERLIRKERAKARQYIFEKLTNSLGDEHLQQLDNLLVAQGSYSGLHQLKQAPQSTSPSAALKLIKKLKRIEQMGLLNVDLDWLNNNFQRSLARYASRCTATRLRELTRDHRYAVLMCFLRQLYHSTVDDLVLMYDRLITKIENSAEDEVNKYMIARRKQMKGVLASFKSVSQLLLDNDVPDNQLRSRIFKTVPEATLTEQMTDIETWLIGKYSHVFNLFVQRYSYLRQFSPHLIEQLDFDMQEESQSSVLEAVQLLRDLNQTKKRKLPDNPPISFLPKNIQSLIKKEGEISKPAWESAVMKAVRDEIKSGNLAVRHSKRYVHIDNFFMPDENWKDIRLEFFKRAKLPVDPAAAIDHLTGLLNQSYDDFLEYLPNNKYAQINDSGWQTSRDPAEKLGPETATELDKLENHLKSKMRVVKLPELLIEVNNDLQFTHYFMSASQQQAPTVKDIRDIIATIMAHGCNIGPHTMSHLTNNVSYNKIKNITDWMLSDESQRSALARLVKAISSLDITQAWGTGKTSSSDAQRFAMRRKLLQQGYSHQFNDFALEFYSFIADNYAPFFSMPIVCTDRDAPHVLDGILYNESDLALEEHYTDTHGYTEINFAAFAMLGRRFCSRIKGLKSQRIYRIDKNKDYGSLDVLVNQHDRTIHLDWIEDQWDRMAQFYASLETGHSTASIALKRLNGFSGKNHFYRANRELGRIFKTIHILEFMSDESMRRRNRRGLLKIEQMHGLARDLNYGQRGRLTKRNWREQKHSCSCLTLILACIIYWQAKEMHRVLIDEVTNEDPKLNLSLLKHVSPVSWDNVILYGEYIIESELIKTEFA